MSLLALNSALALELERDRRVVVLGQDIGANGGVFRVTEHLQKKFGEERVFDTPLAESGIIGASVGMAIYGLRPIAEIQFAGFIFVCMSQLVSQAARIRFRSAGAYTCPLVVRAPYGGGVRTPELHSDSLEGVFLQTPGFKIVVPSNPYDAKGLLASAVDDPDPVLFLENIKLLKISNCIARSAPKRRRSIIPSRWARQTLCRKERMSASLPMARWSMSR